MYMLWLYFCCQGRGRILGKSNGGFLQGAQGAKADALSSEGISPNRLDYDLAQLYSVDEKIAHESMA